MPYEEEARAFNVFSGLALGIALGASVGLLLALDRRPSAAERLRRGVSDLGENAERRLKGWSNGASSRLSTLAAAAR
jgi:hypothetical protein